MCRIDLGTLNHYAAVRETLSVKSSDGALTKAVNVVASLTSKAKGHITNYISLLGNS